MLTHLLHLCAAGQVSDPAVVSLLPFSLDSGACETGGPPSPIERPARVRVGWSVADAPDDLYELELFEDDVRVATLATTATPQWDKTAVDRVEYGPFGQTESDWVYRLDIVRKSDRVVVATRTAEPWRMVYGRCY